MTGKPTGLSANAALAQPDPALCNSAAVRWQIDLRFFSTPEAVRDALDQVVQDVQQQRVSDTARGTVEVVLAEVLNNIVEHAYQEHRSGEIHLTLRLKQTRLYCRVTDSGIALPRLQIPCKKLPELTENIQELPEGGFGWYLICSLAHELNYDRSEDENALTFWLDVGASV